MATEFMDLASSLFAAIFVLTLLFLLNAVHGLKLLKRNSNIGGRPNNNVITDGRNKLKPHQPVIKVTGTMLLVFEEIASGRMKPCW